MPTAPPSAAPESLVSLPVPEMQDRVISMLIWQIAYLLSPRSQEIVLAQKSSVPLWGSFGRWFCTQEQYFPQLTEHVRQKSSVLSSSHLQNRNSVLDTRLYK